MKDKMVQTCTGCNREVTWGRNNCPYCGTSQGIVSRWLNRTLLAGALIGASFVAASYFYANAIENARLEGLAESADQQSALRNQLDQVTAQYEQLRSRLVETESDLKTAQQNGSSEVQELSSQITRLQQSLADSQQESDKQAGRASWLGRENVRLSSEVDELKQQLAALKAAPDEPTQSEQLNKPNPATTEPPLPGDDDEPQ